MHLRARFDDVDAIDLSSALVATICVRDCFLGDPADPEPPGELGFDVGPGKVPVGQQDGGMKHQVGDLLDQMLAAGVAGLAARLDDLRGLFDDLGTDLGHPPAQRLTTYDGSAGRVVLAIADHTHQGRHIDVPA